MAYTIHFGQHVVTLTGFLAVVPFRCEPKLELHPDHAALLCHVELVHSELAAYPAYSAQLPLEATTFALHEEQAGKVLEMTQFSPLWINSSQSTDSALTTWLLTGFRSDACRVDYTAQESPFSHYGVDDKQHFYWAGTLNEQPEDLRLSHASVVQDMASDRSITRLLAFGPSSHQRSIFNWMLQRGKWMAKLGNVAQYQLGDQLVPSLTLKDARRGTAASFFGEAKEDKEQMLGAKGAVFLMNGTLALLSPHRLRWVIQRIAEGRQRLEGVMEELSLLREQELGRTCKDTPEVAHPKQEDTTTLYEGMALWDLKRKAAEAVFL
jgi:hypothetical protein